MQDLQRLSKSVNVNWATIQQAVQASALQSQQAKTSQLQQTQQTPVKTENLPQLVPGAISNRTLEHLTETMTRPVRAIKGGDGNKPMQ